MPPLPPLLALLLLLGACAACDEVAPSVEPDAEASPGPLVLLGPDTDLAAFAHADGRDASWALEDGVMTVNGGGNLVSREVFGDHRIELEFWCPRMDPARGIDRGNSGVYVQGLYEVQVLDSWEMPIELNSCGAIYEISKPAVNASRPPEEWQSYRIDLRAARLGPAGELLEPARISVVHNGVLVQDDVELPTVTPGGLSGDIASTGPLMLQDHGQPVRFRNVRITRL